MIFLFTVFSLSACKNTKFSNMRSLVSYLFANFVIIMKWNQTDREILRLALPCIVSNITVPLLGLVDLSIVGHIGSAAYIAAISVGTMIFSVMYWTMGFLRMGTSGLTAQAYGRDDAGGVRRLLRREIGRASCRERV